MSVEFELRAAVEAAFSITGSGLTPWPDPHHNRTPLDEEYLRIRRLGFDSLRARQSDLAI